MTKALSSYGWGVGIVDGRIVITMNREVAQTLSVELAGARLEQPLCGLFSAICCLLDSDRGAG